MNTVLTKSLLPVALLGALSLVGCNEFKGKIEVLETLQLKVVKGSGEVSPGVYGVTVDFPKKGEVRLEIAYPGKKNNKRAYFKVGNIQGDGEFYIPAQLNGQAYDLAGAVDTQISDSNEQWSRESCTVRVRVRECERLPNGRRDCRMVDRLVTGEKEVRYFYRERQQFLEVNLLEPGAQKTVAKADGRQSSTEKITTFEGPCRFRRR